VIQHVLLRVLLTLVERLELGNPLGLLQTRGQSTAVVVGGVVGGIVPQTPDEGAVEDGVERDVAGVALVEGEAYVDPFVLLEFPSSYGREIFYSC
jgi:hypothetical protein